MGIKGEQGEYNQNEEGEYKKDEVNTIRTKRIQREKLNNRRTTRIQDQHGESKENNANTRRK